MLPLFSRSLNRILVPLVVLSLMLPEMDSLDVTHAIRKEGHTPIITLTARIEEADKLDSRLILCYN